MFVYIDFHVKKPRDLSSMHRRHVLIVLLSKVDNDARLTMVQADSIRAKVFV